WIRRLRVCVHLVSLHIQAVCLAELRVLVNALKPSTTTSTSVFPHLHSIHIDNFGAWLPDRLDENMAELLRACQTRWRSVNLPSLGTVAVETLIKHCGMLEHLVVRRCLGLTSASMQKILSSSPRLVTFSTLESDSLTVRETTHITVKDYIDLDSSLSSQQLLKSWQCELTLEVFRAKIAESLNQTSAHCTVWVPYPQASPKKRTRTKVTISNTMSMNVLRDSQTSNNSS
ncbi:hypothetical protein BG015_002985, partial [Linnemannia schmuckeri]